MVSGKSNIHCRCAAEDPGGTNSPISKREKNDSGMLSANLYALVGVFVPPGSPAAHRQCTLLMPDIIVLDSKNYDNGDNCFVLSRMTMFDRATT